MRRAFVAGDVVELTLPMAARLSVGDPHIDAIRNCVAVERGPLVLCVESVDLRTAGVDTDIADLRLDATVPLHETAGRVMATVEVDRRGDASWPYGRSTEDRPSNRVTREVALTEYHDWAHRGPAAMRVWIPLA